ncbi:hypothetical protein HDU67_007918 [Dinochytrium kinnereticum]|nr:hypothetical protein HDU67_007918 [Dinochytrium kinnereticum]
MATCDVMPANSPCGPALAGVAIYTQGPGTFNNLFEFLASTDSIVSNFVNPTKYACTDGDPLKAATGGLRYQVSLFCAKFVIDGITNECSGSPVPAGSFICAEQMDLAVNTIFELVSNVSVCPAPPASYVSSQYTIFDGVRTENLRNLNLSPSQGCSAGVASDQPRCGFMTDDQLATGCLNASDSCCVAYRQRNGIGASSGTAVVPSTASTATAGPSSRPSNLSPATSGPGIAPIIGGVVGGVIFLIVVVVLAICCIRRRRSNSSSSGSIPYNGKVTDPAFGNKVYQQSLGRSQGPVNGNAYNYTGPTSATGLQPDPYGYYPSTDRQKQQQQQQFGSIGRDQRAQNSSINGNQEQYSSMSRGQAQQMGSLGRSPVGLTSPVAQQNGSLSRDVGRIQTQPQPPNQGSLNRQYNRQPTSPAQQIQAENSRPSTAVESAGSGSVLNISPTLTSTPINPVVAALAAANASGRDSVATDLSGTDDISVLESTMRVVHPYVATLADELQLTVGKDIILLRSFDDGWGLGMNPLTGAQGAFPLVCVVSLEEASRLSMASNARPPSGAQRLQRFSKRVSSALFTSEQMAALRQPLQATDEKKVTRVNGPSPLSGSSGISGEPRNQAQAPRHTPSAQPKPVSAIQRLQEQDVPMTPAEEYFRKNGYDAQLDEDLPSALSTATVATPSLADNSSYTVPNTGNTGIPPVTRPPINGPLKRGVTFDQGAPRFHVYPAARDSVASSVVSSSTYDARSSVVSSSTFDGRS